jgi:hypothetical protein
VAYRRAHEAARRGDRKGRDGGTRHTTHETRDSRHETRRTSVRFPSWLASMSRSPAMQKPADIGTEDTACGHG